LKAGIKGTQRLTVTKKEGKNLAFRQKGELAREGPKSRSWEGHPSDSRGSELTWRPPEGGDRGEGED